VEGLLSKKAANDIVRLSDGNQPGSAIRESCSTAVASVRGRMPMCSASSRGRFTLQLWNSN